MLNWAQKQPFR